MPTGASCTAPVTIGAKFTTNVGWRAAQITPSLRDREGAYADLRPIYISVVIFNFDDPIGVGDTSPSKMLDKSTLSTGACHDRCQF
ncbi:hypothetical protein BZJ21_14065 [Salinivibrio costicola subsp. alcaliphilus]|uniref:Uncharacterized protein n=1 Tax=Salinivibrio costicola subsp. alcaliphilus TaxID=272773 RepID=A0ABX3KM98_SALCS|nr:hypothetical protein BZJ21_14065 [Salinivibrio costicola subsp. alcaliphilus]